eukprot:gene5046-5154_t
MPSTVSAVMLASVGAAAGDLALKMLDSSIPTDLGGRCMDGTMAGYYMRKGTDGGKAWVIHLDGGGGCSDKDKCDS